MINKLSILGDIAMKTVLPSVAKTLNQDLIFYRNLKTRKYLTAAVSAIFFLCLTQPALAGRPPNKPRIF